MTESFYIRTEDAADDVLIFPIGTFYRDGKKREFTKEDAALMVANFKDGVLGETRLPPVNREHKRENGKVGSIADVWLTDDGVRGRVDGDLTGFDYLSPEVRWEWTHPHTNVTHKNVLMGAAATNYPFFLDKMALNSEAALLWMGSDWAEVKQGGERPQNYNKEGGHKMPDEKELLEQQPEVEVPAVPVTLRLPEDFTEKIASLEAQLKAQSEEFTSKLETERTQRKSVEEKFAESEKARRLMHFGDVIATFAAADEPEQFAEDLYAVEQLDAELAERMIARLRANAEAATQGELFAQKSKATAPVIGDPFLAKVEKTRQEHFSEMPVAEGWVEAEKLVERENKELARDYANRTRGGS